MENKNEKLNIQKNEPRQEQQVRGPALRDKMIESEELGKEFRAHNPEDVTQKSQHGHKKPSPKIEIESEDQP